MASKNRASKQEILQTRAAMALAFPNCFVAKGLTKRPLKIGIDKDLFTAARAIFPGMTRRLIVCFLHDYCTGHNYHVTVRKGVVRVGLDGNFTGFVTEAEAANAEQALKAIKAKKTMQKRTACPAVASIGTVAKRAVEKAKPAKALSPLEAAQRDVSRLEQADFASSMSDGRYHISGRYAEVQREIMKAKQRVADLMRKQG